MSEQKPTAVETTEAQPGCAPAAGSGAWFKPGEVVEVNGIGWLVWRENELKDVMLYNLYGAVTVVPRSRLKRIEAPPND